MNKRAIVIIVCLILAILIVAGAAAMLNRNPSEPDETVEPGSVTVGQSDFPQETESDTTISGKPTAPVVDLEDGYEVYLDEEIIAEITYMEQKGEEDTVNEILDWIILLINRFAGNGYSPEAIRQVQRFYYLFRNEIMQEDFNTVCVRIEQCIPEEGANQDSFARTVEKAFGWESGNDYSYVFAAEEMA